MMRLSCCAAMLSGLFVLAGVPTARGGITVTFDELSDYSVTEPDGSYYDGRDPSASGDYTRDATWTSQGVQFHLTYNRQTFGGTTYEFWNGWAYSNVNDTTTDGFQNQYAAFTGVDHSGTGNRNYAVGFPEAIIDLPAGYLPSSVAVTNTTYTALYIRDGKASPLDPPGPYEPSDYFDVIFTGYAGPGASSAITGSVTFRLADGPNPIDTWVEVDLSGLGAARSIGLSFDSSDRGTWGINTPTYVAIDSLKLSAVPEPSAGVLVGIGAVCFFVRRRSGRRWRLAVDSAGGQHLAAS